MRFNKVPSKDAYDVIVIGGGMGGLSAGAGLAHLGAKVLVVEAHYRAGGYAHAFRRKKFLFDAAVHLTPGGGKGEKIHSLLEEWGVADRVKFIPIQPMYRAIRPDLDMFVRSGKEDFIESHVQHFPAEREGIRQFVELMDRMSKEIHTYSNMDIPPAQVVRTMLKYSPTVLRMSSKTLLQMVQQFVKDPAAQSVLSTLWPYMGLPPSRCSAVQFAEMMMSFVNQHAYYVEGSFQKLADAFVFALEKAGSELVMPRVVEKILLDDKGRACGVKLDKAGEEIRARCVISNADALQTFLGMIGEERLDAGFVATLKERPISLSAFEVFLGVNTDLKAMGINHEIFFAPSNDTEEAFSSQARGEVHGCGLSIPSIDDPTLAPPGHHTLCVKMFAPWDRRWVEDKAVLAERLIDEAEKVIPGLRKGIVYQESGTPFTMSRYTGNTAGAIYGWDAAPKSITQRLNMETPVPGLFLSGHWTRPGGGVLAVVMSGQMAAKRVFQELLNRS